MTDTATDSAVQTHLLATFYVAGTMCGLDAASVQEVIRMDSVTPVYHAPDDVAGVMNLRGRIITILDLSRILGFVKTEITSQSRVFILEHQNEFIGLLVDRAGEVLELETGYRRELPANLPPAQARFFQGICRSGECVIALLDSMQVLNEGRE